MFPWDEPQFEDFIRVVADRVLLTNEKCYVLYTLARNCAYLDGDFAECGVYKGGAAYLITLASLDKEVHLFDTFTGIPNSGITSVDKHKAGDFSDVSFDDVRAFLARFSDRIYYHQGIIPYTLNIVDRKWAFVHIDVDIYQTYLACLQYFYPRMVKGGIMLVDDYLWEYCPGCKKAVDEFFIDKVEIPLILPSMQAVIIKR